MKSSPANCRRDLRPVGMLAILILSAHPIPVWAEGGNAALPGAAPARAAGSGRSVLPEGIVVHRDLDYVGDADPRHRLDLYLPQEGVAVPLIIHIHGGAFRMGSKDADVPVDYVSRGYAVASINYRLSQQAVVDYFGPTDFLPMDAHRVPGGQVHDAADSPESQLVGGPILENRERTARANPIR